MNTKQNDNTQNQLSAEQAAAAIKQAFNLLADAIGSRHIVFTSPSPSSTEAAARRNIRNAKNNLDIAMSLMRL